MKISVSGIMHLDKCAKTIQSYFRERLSELPNGDAGKEQREKMKEVVLAAQNVENHVRQLMNAEISVKG